MWFMVLLMFCKCFQMLFRSCTWVFFSSTTTHPLFVFCSWCYQCCLWCFPPFVIGISPTLLCKLELHWRFNFFALISFITNICTSNIPLIIFSSNFVFFFLKCILFLVSCFLFYFFLALYVIVHMFEIMFWYYFFVFISIGHACKFHISLGRSFFNAFDLHS